MNQQCIRLGVIVCDDSSLFVLCFVIIALVVVGLVGRTVFRFISSRVLYCSNAHIVILP